MAARAPRQRPTYPHWHTSWGVVDKGDLFGDQMSPLGSLQRSQSVSWFSLVHQLDGPCLIGLMHVRIVWSKSSSVSISIIISCSLGDIRGCRASSRRLAVLFSSVIVIRPDDNEGGEGGEASDQIIQPDTTASKSNAVQERLSKGVPRQVTA